MSSTQRRCAPPILLSLISALLALVCVVGSGLAMGTSAGAGAASAGAGAAVSTTEYGGGRMMAADPNGGYWTVGATGALTLYDGATSFGSPALSGLTLQRPIVGMASMPDGNGYWLVASDGGIFSYGDAQFYGSTGATHLNQPIVGMASTPDGNGYWLVASDGGIFSYGNASFFGSTGAVHLNQPVVAMASTPDGNGYWLVASDGGIFSYGDASFFGSTAGSGAGASGVVVDPPQAAYALISQNGSATYFGHGPNGGVQLPATTNRRAPTTTTTRAPTTTTTRAPTTTTTTAPKSTTTTTPASPATTTTGALSGSYDGAASPAGAAAFATETGTTTSIYSDYLQGGDGWPVEVGTAGSPPWVIGQLKGQLGAQRLELSVPLMSSGYSSNQAALAAYAANPATWDAQFTILAQNLVADGFSNAIIRLMWEPDALGTYANDDLTSAANYATLWRDAYTAMASVAGANFAWAWYWAPGFDSATNNAAYPGNAYVNYVSLDFYDQAWVASCGIPYNGAAFSATQEACLWASPQGYGAELKSFANFAAIVGKPMAFGEWGVITRSDNHGGGDDPTFINDFSAWIKANNVAWISYFNFNSGGNATLDDYPNSLAAYAADFG